MKKLLLSISAVALAFAANAQKVTGWVANYDTTAKKGNNNCWVNSANSGGYAWADGNILNVKYTSSVPKQVTSLLITGKTGAAFKTGASTPAPGLFDLGAVYGSGPTAQCNPLRDSAAPQNPNNIRGIDLSDINKQKVSFTASSSIDGDSIHFFLFSSADGGYPTTSATIGKKGFVARFKLSKTKATYIVDFNKPAAGDTNLSAWDGKNMVNGYGITLLKPGTQINLYDVRFGDSAVVAGSIPALGLENNDVANLELTVAPNPATEKATISYSSQAGKSVSVVLSNGVSTVATIAGGESSTEVNVAGLAAGLYYASVYVDGAYASTAKILVK